MSDLNLDDFYFDNDSYIKSQIRDLDLSGLTGGKHLRSKLLSLTGKAVSLTEDQLRSLGRVVELVHNATLTHDDVIDNSHTRRNSPSIPALINNKKSVLLGDYMLARALHELSSFNNPKLTAELTLTLKDLVEGEWIQYENTNPYEITATMYETLAVKKTGSLFRWCFIAPLVAFEPDSPLYSDYLQLGEQLGIIFQMSDDMIDFNKESKKSYGLDFRNNNINYVLQFVGENHPEYKKKFLQLDSIEELGPKEMEAIDKCIDIAKDKIDLKLKNCSEIIERVRSKLGDLDQTYLNELHSIITLLKSRVF
jgi:geranylgeranyl pyrophosphate synthase